VDLDVAAAGPLGDHPLQRVGGKVGIAVRRNGRLNLEQVCSREGADSHHPFHVAVFELVPGIAVEPAQIDVGHDRAHAERFAGKADPECAADRAAAAVSADQIAGTDLPNGRSSRSTMRKDTPRRASSIASVSPAAPAPQIRTSISIRSFTMNSYVHNAHIQGRRAGAK
jgi:hypothetical protein